MEPLPRHDGGGATPILEEAVTALPAASLRAALIGRGIGQSRTPGMHRAEGRRLGLDYDYSLLDFDRLELPDSALPAVLATAGRHGFAGLNVTHPFKQAVIPLLDALSPEAAAIGAVNTVVFGDDGRATGHNTDCWGFAEAFRGEMPGEALGQVLLIGAGGAGKAAAHALAGLGAGRLLIHDNDPTAAAALSEALGGRYGASRADVAADVGGAAATSDGLVNATPVGMDKYPGMPVPETVLRPTLWVADVVYFPERTQLLAVASARGCRTMGGRGMAIGQAVMAFRLITGRDPDPEAMAMHFVSHASGEARG